MIDSLHFFLRRARLAFALAFATLSFGTVTSRLASASNSAHPLGFFFATVPSFRCSRPPCAAGEINESISAQVGDCNPAISHACAASNAEGQFHFTVCRPFADCPQATSLERSHLCQPHKSSAIDTAEHARPRIAFSRRFACMFAARPRQCSSGVAVPLPVALLNCRLTVRSPSVFR